MHNFITANEIMMSDWFVVSTLMMSNSSDQYYKTLAKFDQETTLKIHSTVKHFSVDGYIPFVIPHSVFCEFCISHLQPVGMVKIKSWEATIHTKFWEGLSTVDIWAGAL